MGYGPKECIVSIRKIRSLFDAKNFDEGYSQKYCNVSCSYKQEMNYIKCKICSIMFLQQSVEDVISRLVSIKANSRLIKLWSNTKNKEMKLEWDGGKQKHREERMFRLKKIALGTTWTWQVENNSREEIYDDR